MRHDRWSKMGEENLGGPEGGNLRFTHLGRTKEEGIFTLMKCILNDHWADVPPASLNQGWDRKHIDYVMSKIYYCWVAMLEERHPPTENEECIECDSKYPMSWHPSGLCQPCYLLFKQRLRDGEVPGDE